MPPLIFVASEQPPANLLEISPSVGAVYSHEGSRDYGNSPVISNLYPPQKIPNCHVKKRDHFIQERDSLLLSPIHFFRGYSFKLRGFPSTNQDFHRFFHLKDEDFVPRKTRGLEGSDFLVGSTQELDPQQLGRFKAKQNSPLRLVAGSDRGEPVCSD